MAHFSWENLNKKLSNCVTWPKKAGSNMSKWFDACVTVGLKKKKLYAPVKTRFGSVVMFLRRIFDYRKAIEHCYGTRRALKYRVPTEYEWQVVEQILQITEPIFWMCTNCASKSCWVLSDAFRYKNNISLCIKLYEFSNFMVHFRYALTVLNLMKKNIAKYSTPTSIDGYESECRVYFLRMATAGYNYIKSHLSFLFQ
jgi:hypothetical protein